MIGQSLSHYKILEKLGEGGMGVVYKAEDLTLTRLVALKFLPHGLQTHESERARFLQEARAAAILNHPAICTIHEIADAEGQQFIVMEYVDGVTLRDKIAAGPLSVELAVALAIQIGEALDEAHAKGIVHRDIKTENIMVVKNQVKVMDFGLAKLKGSLKLTKTSSTVGTLAYMAPELIEGKESDARSDIFSFGVVLYEMLTGHLPFRGEHEAALMYSIVNEEPQSIQSFLPEAPSELLHVLNRALEKDPEERYQTVHDMVIDLRRLKKETTRVVRFPQPIEKTGAVPAQSPQRRLKGKLALILGSAIGGLGAIVAILLLSSGPELNADMKFRVVQLPFRNVSYAGMSEDGNWIAFPAQDERGTFDVYMMNVAQGQPRRITHDSCYSMHGVSLSPDGSTILYSRRLAPLTPMQVVSVSSLGGTGRVLADSAYNQSWTADGKRFGYMHSQPLSAAFALHEWWSCNADGSDRRLEISDTVAERSGIRVSFHYSPDGRSIAWTKNFPEGHSEIMIRELESGKDRQLTHDRKFADDPLWGRTGHIFYSSNRGGNVNIWMVPAGGGEAVQITRGGGPDSPLGMTSNGKRLIYSEVQDIGQVKVASLKDGGVRQLTVDEWQRGMAAISPSGRWIAFPAQEIDAISTGRNIYVMDRNGGSIRKLTDDATAKFYPAWSPDEKWITYSARPGNEPDDSLRIFMIRSDKPGTPMLMGRGIFPQWYSEKDFVGWSVRWGTSLRSIDAPEALQFSGDSVMALPVLDGRYVVALDWHRGQTGWWITTSSAWNSSGIGQARRLTRGVSYATFPVGARSMYYLPLGSGELRRLSLPDGKDEALIRPPGLRLFFSVSTTTDEVAYTEVYRKMRFVLIEDVFN